MMQRLYRNNPLYFALAWIGIYALSMSLADELSRAVGVEKLFTVPASMGLSAVILGFLHRNGLMTAFGLCRFEGNAGDYLWFLPLLLLPGANLCRGISLRTPLTETVLFVVSMAFVGFLEEVLFRGFLFKALLGEHEKTAIFLSSVTFGAGHLVNLFNGAAFAATLLQVCYASAIGFLFTVIFFRGKSLWPCILAHALFNAFSIFGTGFASRTGEVVMTAALCLLSLWYGFRILRRTAPPCSIPARN